MRLLVVVTLLSACGGDDPGRRCAAFELGAAFAQPAGMYAADLTLADINGDRHLDVVYRKGGALAVKLQFSDGSLGDAITTPMFDGVRDDERFILGDVDGDGALDAVVSATPGTIRVAHGLVDGTFTPGATSDVRIPSDGVVVLDLEAADADGDGAADLVVVTTGSLNGVWLARGDGHGAFGEAAKLGVNSLQTPRMAVLADATGDGLTDIIVADEGLVSPGGAQSGGGVEVLARVDGGTFSDATAVSDASRVLAVGDLDANGRPDVVADRFTTVFEPDRVVSVVYADRADQFSRVALDAGGAVDTVPRMLDLDGDGRLDIVYGVDRGAGIAVQLNTGDRAFYLLREDTGVTGALTIAAGDVTGDGTPDVVFTNNDQIVVLPGICE